MPFASITARREYARLWIARRRFDFFKDKVCFDCGGKETLELDHVDPSLKVSHKIWSWSEQRRTQEISKCVVRCHKCHRNKTDRDLNQGYIVHGDYFRGYRNGCRCTECRKVNSEKRKDERKKKKLSQHVSASVAQLDLER